MNKTLEKALLLNLFFVVFISVNPCDKAVTPCKNKGVCVKKETTFTCECAQGYEGETCEEKVIMTVTNPCDNDPCKNGAICKVSSSSTEAVCICPPGFIGKTCGEKGGTGLNDLITFVPFSRRLMSLIRYESKKRFKFNVGMTSDASDLLVREASRALF